MADTALVIVEGRVTDIEKRSGTKDGNSWTMETLHVLVANRGMVEINSPRTWGVTGGDIPAIGDDVSWLVRLTAGRFGLSGSIAGLAPRPLNSAGQTASTVHDLSDHTGELHYVRSGELPAAEIPDSLTDPVAYDAWADSHATADA